MTDRARVATVWLGGCSGCHMSFLDMDEFLFDLAARIDLVYSPLVDFKDYPDEVDVCLVEGAVSSEDDLAKVKATLEALLAEDERILTDPEPTIGVLALADSSVNFAVLETGADRTHVVTLRLPLRGVAVTMQRGAGFYTSRWGPVPFRLGRPVYEDYDLFRTEQGFVLGRR